MRLRIGTPRSLIVIAPHPDDETIGAYGLMRRMCHRGIVVRVLVVTDGAASHPGSLVWPRRRLVRARQRETRAAVRRIGVPAGNVTFLGLPDGATRPADARRGIATALHRTIKPALIVGPAAGDDHADHRATAVAIRAARLPGIRRLAYPVWPAGDRLRGARSLPLTPGERLAKRHAIRSYRTQTGCIVDDPDGFALTAAQIAAFSRPTETFVDLCR